MKPTVLYIEDHPDNMTLVRRILQSESYTLIEAKTGGRMFRHVLRLVNDIPLSDFRLEEPDPVPVLVRLGLLVP